MLKTKGYHLEHNFGHGQEHLSSLLATLNLLAFARHTLLELADADYQPIRIDGTVNDDQDRDRGWTVELALPWKGLQWLAKADHRLLPPHEVDVWRMDFSRFNTDKAPAPAKDSGGWVWTRHGIWDSHIPECFSHIRFSTNLVSAIAPPARRK